MCFSRALEEHGALGSPQALDAPVPFLQRQGTVDGWVLASAAWASPPGSSLETEAEIASRRLWGAGERGEGKQGCLDTAPGCSHCLMAVDKQTMSGQGKTGSGPRHFPGSPGNFGLFTRAGSSEGQ